MTPLHFASLPASRAVGLCVASLGVYAPANRRSKIQRWMDLSTLPTPVVGISGEVLNPIHLLLRGLLGR